MLEELLIRDVGVIREVTLRLGPGLNVLTGETGAGKTMVVSALELLLGARADADQVRAGAAAAVVEGRLHPAPQEAADWIDPADDELVVSREVAARDAGGRSRARLGGRLAPVSALADAVGGAIEIHGQSDSFRLSTPGVQRDLLDRCGGEALGAARAAYTEVYSDWLQRAEELEALQASQRDRAREIDRLAFELSEIDAVEPVAGEEEELEADLRRLEHAEALIAAAQAAASTLAADGGARDALGSAVAALRAVEGVDDDLEELHRRVEGLAVEVQDVVMELNAYAERLDLDPEGLERMRQRRAGLARLGRKYGADAAAIIEYAESARQTLAGLQGGDARAEALAGEVAELAQAVGAAGQALTEARLSAGKRLADGVHRHLAELAMADARMEVDVEPAQPGPNGADRVAFLLAANAGEPMLALGKAASGGERSRVALALRLALADADDTPVLVFDEVDAGIGGATARAVGEKLARLARGRQVLCVTHLAQLAAFADVHFVVAKDTAGGRTVAGVRPVEGEERVAELSRMLSGASESRAAAGHAAELLAQARAAIAH